MLAFEIFRLHSQLFASSQCIVAYQYILCLEYNNTSDVAREWEGLLEYSSSQRMRGGIWNVDESGGPWF